MVVDPITVEVIRNKLIATVREMSSSLKRASYSPIIYEVKDFSNVLLDPAGQLIAQAEGIPIFIGAMGPILKAALQKYSLEDLHPGDILISNDPYVGGGTHKPDVNVIQPLFAPGEEKPVLFAISKAHWADVGGIAPGSWSPKATDGFQEGVSIPPLRICREGKLNEELLELLLANTRVPENNRGDFKAQLAACHTAEMRVKEILAKYGWPTLRTAINAILDHAERLVRKEIEKIPDGTYTAVDFVDSDGVNDEPIRVEVKVEIKGSDVRVDLSGCAAQRSGPCGNMSLAGTLSAIRVAFKCLTLPHLPGNEGFFRPLQVIAPRGTIVNPDPPAPLTIGLGDVSRAVMEAIFFALSEAVPEKTMAGQFGNVLGIAIAGPDRKKEGMFVHVMPYAGGWGARQKKDGINALCPLVNGDNSNVPCEVIENKFPLRVERYELRDGSGGAGKQRGGLGVTMEYRILSEYAVVTGSFDRYKFNPPGLQNGREGAPSRLSFRLPGEQEIVEHKPSGFVLPQGSVICHQSGGGGGFGDPLEREDESVLRDVRDGYVSVEAAFQDYGVVCDPVELRLDIEQTRAERQERKARGKSFQRRTG